MDDVLTAPVGTGRAAFFDVDETLVDLKSMASFLDFHRAGHVGRAPLADGPWARFVADLPGGLPRAEVNDRYYRLWQGERLDEVQASARHWWRALRSEGDVTVAAGVRALAAHRAAGDLVVLVSGSFGAALAPVADELGADDVLCTEPLVDASGVLTGRTRGPMIGAAKAGAVRAWLAARGLDAAACAAYGDHESDLPMLEQVGSPHVVGGSAELVALAAARGWVHLT